MTFCMWRFTIKEMRGENMCCTNVYYQTSTRLRAYKVRLTFKPSTFWEEMCCFKKIRTFYLVVCLNATNTCTARHVSPRVTPLDKVWDVPNSKFEWRHIVKIIVTQFFAWGMCKYVHTRFILRANGSDILYTGKTKNL